MSRIWTGSGIELPWCLRASLFAAQKSTSRNFHYRSTFPIHHAVCFEALARCSMISSRGVCDKTLSLVLTWGTCLSFPAYQALLTAPGAPPGLRWTFILFFSLGLDLTALGLLA